MKHLTSCLFCAALISMPFNVLAQRTERQLEKGWKFTRLDDAQFARADYNDAKWKTVTVPHDWAIYGPFSIDNDKQNTAIAQDGQTQAMEHAGRTGGLPFVGTGWYRLSFEVPEFKDNKRCTLVFDGAMSHAQVYINGEKAVYWPYGYNTFYVDATPFLKKGAKNELAVRLENQNESSRWYPGAGIYRNVHLIVTEDAHVPVWGTQVVTDEIGSDYARISQKTDLEVPAGKSLKGYTLVTEIKDATGRVVAQNRCSAESAKAQHYTQQFVVENPQLWTVDTPNLYTSESRIYEGSTLKDTYTTTFGIRQVKLEAGKGFFLNGKLIKFKGICQHHDLGALGAEVNMAAIRRQIRILKDMGCNAIRTSHNMPAPELVQACDEMGMMLMGESFDEWITPKVQNGYHQFFNEWAERDIDHLVRHYRNNPSIVMWCIGNEVPDQDDGDRGTKIAYRLQQLCHQLDPTRPVTQGMDHPDAVVNNGMAAAMEIPGFNYRPHKYLENIKKLPQGFLLGTESASTISSRGVYKFPVERKAMAKYPDHQASSYDVEHCSWSNLPEDDWIQHDDLPWCMGEFVWTGFDYLGEPSPYYTDWPSHASLFGIIDMGGIPKDRYYLYRSHWNKQAETLHILPHWNWAGREGEVTPVFVYTNYPKAELFINGKSQGVVEKDTTVTVYNSADAESQRTFKRQRRYRLMWMNTKYEPGTLKVVAYDAQGHVAATREMHTAGVPYAIRLEADRTSLTADGKDLSFVTVSVVDKDGNLCPLADNEIKYTVTGAGHYKAGTNGNPASLESLQRPQMKVFSGQMSAIISTTEQPGTITVKASAKGLKTATLKLISH